MARYDFGTIWFLQKARAWASRNTLTATPSHSFRLQRSRDGCDCEEKHKVPAGVSAEVHPGFWLDAELAPGTKLWALPHCFIV